MQQICCPDKVQKQHVKKLKADSNVDGNSIFLPGGIFQGKSRHNQVREKCKFYGNEVVSTIGAVSFLRDKRENRSNMRQP